MAIKDVLRSLTGRLRGSHATETAPPTPGPESVGAPKPGQQGGPKSATTTDSRVSDEMVAAGTAGATSSPVAKTPVPPPKNT
jgi:hypothetical protein